MNLNEQHVHHMAKRLHQAHSKLAELRDRFAGATERFVSTLEVGGGAFIGGVIEGRTEGGALFGHVPYNLAGGALLLAAGHLELAGEEWSDHLNNVGNGLLAGYIASKGYAFGKRWHDTGKFLGGGSTPELPGAAVSGEFDPRAMQGMVAAMNQAAGAGA